MGRAAPALISRTCARRLRRAPFGATRATDHQSRDASTCTRPNRPPNIGRASLSNGARASCSRSSSSSPPISSPRRCSGRLRGSSTRLPILKRHPGAGGDSVGKELGRLGYWLVWLVGLIAALQPLGLSGVLTPVTSMTNEVFAFLPRLLGAGLFFFAGLILARIVRHVIEAALGALNLERLAGQRRAQARRRSGRGRQPRHRQRGRRPGAQLDRPRGRRHRLGDRSSSSPPSARSRSSRSRRSATPRRRCSTPSPPPFRACSRRWCGWRSPSSSASWVKTLIETVLPSLGFDDNVRALGHHARQRQSRRASSARSP